jgi:hypothetical protein
MCRARRRRRHSRTVRPQAASCAAAADSSSVPGTLGNSHSPASSPVLARRRRAAQPPPEQDEHRPLLPAAGPFRRLHRQGRRRAPAAGPGTARPGGTPRTGAPRRGRTPRGPQVHQGLVEYPACPPENPGASRRPCSAARTALLRRRSGHVVVRSPSGGRRQSAARCRPLPPPAPRTQAEAIGAGRVRSPRRAASPASRDRVGEAPAPLPVGHHSWAERFCRFRARL